MDKINKCGKFEDDRALLSYFRRVKIMQKFDTLWGVTRRSGPTYLISTSDLGLLEKNV